MATPPSSKSDATVMTVASSHATDIAHGLDMIGIMESATELRKKVSMTYATDAHGQPVGLPLDLFMFSQAIHTPVAPQNVTDPIRDFSYENQQPETKQFPYFEYGKMLGHIPLSNEFHMESNRERSGPLDDGLEDEDLTAADGIIRKKKVQVIKRRSIIYDSIRTVKGEFIFPYKTYKPKVQVAYTVPAGQLPQGVVVERLHRHFKKVDINLVLQTCGVEQSDLIPPPNYCETNERFYQEMVFRSRVRVNGIFKKEFIIHGNNALQQHEEHHRRLHAPKDESVSSRSTSDSYDSSESTPDEFEEEEEMEEEEGSTREDSSTNHDETTPITQSQKHPTTNHPHPSDDATTHPFIRSKPPFTPMLPLHLFDNSEYDTRMPEDWLALGWDTKERRFYPLPGKAFLPLPGSVVRKTAPALSETIVDHLLSSSTRLQKLFKWLLKERYDRTIKLLGIKPERLEYEPTDSEMQLLARLGCTVPSLFTDSSDDLLTRGRQLLGKKTVLRLDNDDSNKSLDNDSEMELHGEGSLEDIDRHRPATIDIDGKAMPLYNVISKKRPDKCPGDDSDDSEFEDDDSEDEDAPKKGNEEAAAEAEKAAAAAAKKAQGEKAAEQAGQTASGDLAEDEESGLEDSGKDSDDEDYYPAFPLRSYVLGESLPTRPGSLDLDPLVDGHDKYVYEYHKMKKVHVYDWKWVDVAVFDFNVATQRYYVRSIHPPLVHAWIDKIYLCFDGEDPDRHGHRIRDAVIRRYEAENLIRFNLYLDSLPMHHLPGLPPKTMEAILRKCLAASGVTYTDESLERVQEELNLDYRRTIARGIFINIIEKHPHLYKPWAIIPNELRIDNEVVLKDWKHYDESEIPKQPFSYKVKKIQKLSVVFQKEPYEIYKMVNEICLKARSKKLILTDLGPLPLHEWHKSQKDNIEEVREYLRNEWYTSIIQTVRENFGKIPKSWYNIYETRYDVFQMSKISNFLFLVKLYMESTMRSMVVESLDGFISLVKEVVQNVDLKNRFEWNTEDLKQSLYPTPKGTSPIWVLELVMDKDYPKCSHMLSSFGRVVTGIFSSAINSVKGFPAFLPQIMPSLNFATISFLEPLDENEPIFLSMESAIKKYIKRALLPVDSYVQLYKKYVETWNLDIPQFIEEWAAEEHTSQDVRELVESHISHRKQLEEEIPDEINITGVQLIVEYVRTGILKRKRKLCNAILDSYANRLRTIIRGVKEAYREIERKFNIRSDDIEEVMELKRYVENEIPDIVSELETITGQVIKDYEVFDAFMYRVPSEDTRITWQAALSAQRILKSATTAAKWLDQDYNRLLQIQQSYLSAVSDQVDSAGLMVAGLVRFMELEKAIDVYPEVQKVYQMVKDLQVHSELLNHRQNVFGLPLLQNLALERLGVDIAPFKKVWYVGSEWVRLKAALSKNSIDEVDIDGLQFIIEQADEIIEECVKELEEADLEQIALVGSTIKYQMDQFRPLIPLVRTLKNANMRQRHWEAITEICGFNVSPEAENFQSLLDQGIQPFADAIVEIGDLATKEVLIEEHLDFMDQHIGEYFMGLDIDEATKLKIITLDPETIEAIRDYVLDTDSLMANSFNRPFARQLEAWEKRIRLTKIYMELWLEIQEDRLKIEPQFKDIPKRLAVKFKMFKKIKRIWRRLIRFAKSTPLLIDLLTDANVQASLRQLKELLIKISPPLQPKKADAKPNE